MKQVVIDSEKFSMTQPPAASDLLVVTEKTPLLEKTYARTLNRVQPTISRIQHIPVFAGS
jgi:hypothetical protein